MLKIFHRINRLDQLHNVQNSVSPSINFGIEIDVRYHENNLVLHHDPLNHHINNPILLKDFLKIYNFTGPLILNIKTEGIEKECINLIQQFNIKNWFFLDLSMPYFVKYSLIAQNGSINGFTPDNLAVRFSEYEPIEYALSFSNKARWVWVDCFTKLHLDTTIYKQLKDAGFKICLVSPELQGHDISRIKEFKEILDLNKIIIDAVCSTRIDLW